MTTDDLSIFTGDALTMALKTDSLSANGFKRVQRRQVADELKRDHGERAKDGRAESGRRGRTTHGRRRKFKELTPADSDSLRITLADDPIINGISLPVFLSLSLTYVSLSRFLKTGCAVYWSLLY